jgi:hypothetical protein
MARDREQVSVCCCCQQQQHFCIYVVSSGLNKILGWQFYLISALSLFVSHALNYGSHMPSESWDLGKMAHLWTCQQLEKPKKAERFLKFCWCKYMTCKWQYSNPKTVSDTKHGLELWTNCVWAGDSLAAHKSKKLAQWMSMRWKTYLTSSRREFGMKRW